MIWRPPSTTLFPYTTLFRSLATTDGGETWAAYDTPIVQGTPSSGGLDRKSTRLNSSHTVISYAVFCLKKKKRKTQIKPITYGRRPQTQQQGRQRRDRRAMSR